MPQANAKSSNKIISITNRARFVAIIFGLMILASAIIGMFYINLQANKDAEGRLLNRVQVSTSVLQEQINSYRRLLSRIVSRSEVIDLFITGEKEAAFRWAVEQRGYLPDGIGLALISADGEVLGDPGNLRLGNACIRDLKKVIGGLAIERPAVHRDIVDLEHFDLIVPVPDDEGMNLGAMFASFSIKVLQDSLLRLAKDQLYLEIRDGHNGLVAQSHVYYSVNDVQTIERRIPDSDWVLIASIPREGLQNSHIFIIILFVLIAFIVAFFVIRLVNNTCRDFREEITGIESALNSVVDGSYKDNVLQPAFKETMDILPAINDLSSKINNQKNNLLSLSETDELTKLANRRKFNLDLERAWSMSTRGINVCLVLMDLDHFKAINDESGHECGDSILQLFADCLIRASRTEDIAARIGGDEFAILLVQTDVSEAEEWYKRIKADFEQRQLKIRQSDTKTLCTISAGLIKLDSLSQTSHIESLKLADERIYTAKRAGRDQMCSE